MDFPRNSGMIAESEEKTMGGRPRRNHSLAFKAKVAVETIRGEKTLIELSQAHDVHPNQVKQWRDQLLEAATGIFGDTGKSDTAPTIDFKDLHAKIGQLPHAGFLSRPLRTLHGVIGALGVKPAGADLFSEDRRMVQAIVDQVCLALERTQLAGEASDARANAEGEKPRSALLEQRSVTLICNLLHRNCLSIPRA